MARQTHSDFFTGGPSAVVCVCRRKCSPSCGRLHRQTVKPLPPPVSSLLPTICLVGRTMAPSQLPAAPTPRRYDGSKDKKTKQTSVLDFAIWDNTAVIFLCPRLPEGQQQKNRETQKFIAFSNGRTIQWAFRSDRPGPVLESFWQVRTRAMM